MRHFTFIIAICIALSACTSGYKKADRGYEYKIISGAGGKQLLYGNILEYHLKQMYKDGNKDTVLFDSREYMPRIQTMDSSNIPPNLLDVFREAANGDSIVLRRSTDSAYLKPGEEPWPFVKPGGYLYTTIKILNVFTDKDQADSVNRAELRINGLKIYTKELSKFEKKIEQDKAQIEADSKTISAWLDKNNIKYTRGKWGTFVAIHEPGTDRKIAYNDVVGVYYTGKTLDSGKVFNSNIDPKFNNTDMYEVTMSRLGAVMPGWTDALMLLNEGSKATLYIPSSLAFGKKGFLPQIKPNTNIIFDIEVRKVITEDRAMEIVSENRRRAEAAQGRITDTLKTKPAKSPVNPF